MPPGCAGPEAAGLFCDDLLQDVAVEAQIRHQPLEFAILLAELPELPEFAQPQAGVFLLPHVERLLADGVFATHGDGRLAGLHLPEDPENLLFAASFLGHRHGLLSTIREPRDGQNRNFPVDQFSGFGSVERLHRTTDQEHEAKSKDTEKQRS